MDATVVCIDQTETSVNVEPAQAWIPQQSRISVALSGQRDRTCVLGAVTENGESFVSRFRESVTADRAKYFTFALCEEPIDNLIIVLDGAPSFRATAVTDLATQDVLTFVRLPSCSAELNPSRSAGDNSKRPSAPLLRLDQRTHDSN